MIAYGKCALIYLNYKFYINTEIQSNLSNPKHIGTEDAEFLLEPPAVWGENQGTKVNVQIEEIYINQIYEVIWKTEIKKF